MASFCAGRTSTRSACLPTVDETRAFLADTAPDKRDRLIEPLLARPEFIDYWSYKWSDLLLVNSEKLAPAAMWAYYSWIRNQVAANTPWDQFARRIVTATGSTLENGAANFFVLHEDPLEMPETTSQAFLGMSINCAHCHNHPLEKWTNGQYYGMANSVRPRARRRAAAGRRQPDRVRHDRRGADSAATGPPQPPRPLDGQPIPLAATSRSPAGAGRLADVAGESVFQPGDHQPRLGEFSGVGLVEAVDDVRLTNPASNAELLAALAKHLVDNHYDLKALMRVILQSETYQRSSQTLAENAADRALLLALFPAANAGRSAARRDLASERHAERVQGLRRRLAGDAVARLERRFVLS